MAWTVKTTGNVVTIIPAAGNTDNFLYSNSTYGLPPEGLKINSIQVVFSAASDKIVIHDGSITGPEMFNYTTVDGSSVAKEMYKGLYKPFLVHSELTYTTPANWRIILLVD